MSGTDSGHRRTSQFASAVARLNSSSGSLAAELNDIGTARSPHHRRSKFSPAGRSKPSVPRDSRSHLVSPTSTAAAYPTQSRPNKTDGRTAARPGGKHKYAGSSLTPKSATKSPAVTGFNGLPFTPSPTSNRSAVDKRRSQIKALAPPLVDGPSMSSSTFSLSLSPSPSPIRKHAFLSKTGVPTLSPTPFAKSPANGKKHAISFQAPSPMQQPKKPTVPSNFAHYGGSYINRGANSSSNNPNTTATTTAAAATAKPAPPSTPNTTNPMGHIADIKIEAKIPDVEQKLAARRRARQTASSRTKYAHEMDDEDANLPEAIRKFRQREKARQAALDEKQRQAEQTIYAVIVGWYRRKQYPKLLQENAERLRKLKEERELRQKKQRSATKIQAAWRSVLPRKEFKRLIAIRRRREKNQNRIKQIERKLRSMEKTTKADIKEMKKEYAAKKKKLKKAVKDTYTHDEKKLEEIRRQGANMIEYMQEENKRLREMKVVLKKDMKILEKEATELKQHGDSISAKFQSLREFAEKKAQKVQRKEIDSSKCRNRYLPKYRAELAERAKFCIAEHRVKTLYKERLHMIVKEIQLRSPRSEICSNAVTLVAECEAELSTIPDVPVPVDLLQFMK